MSEMTIIPDLYLEGDSKRWKNWQAIYLDIKPVRIAAKSMVKYTALTQSVISRSMSVADVLLYQCEQKRLDLQPIEALTVLMHGYYIVIGYRIIMLQKM